MQTQGLKIKYRKALFLFFFRVSLCDVKGMGYLAWKRGFKFEEQPFNEEMPEVRTVSHPPLLATHNYETSIGCHGLFFFLFFLIKMWWWWWEFQIQNIKLNTQKIDISHGSKPLLYWGLQPSFSSVLKPWYDDKKMNNWLRQVKMTQWGWLHSWTTYSPCNALQI